MRRELVQALCLVAMVMVSGCRDKAPVMLQEMVRPVTEVTVAKPKLERVGKPAPSVGLLSETDLLRLLDLQGEKDSDTASTPLSAGERFLVSELTR